MCHLEPPTGLPYRIQEASRRQRSHSRLCCGAVEPRGGEQQLGGDWLRADSHFSGWDALVSAWVAMQAVGHEGMSGQRKCSHHSLRSV